MISHSSIPSCLWPWTPVKPSPYLLWPVRPAVSWYERNSSRPILWKRGSEGASPRQNIHRNSHLIPTLELSLAAMADFEDRDKGQQEAFCPEFTKSHRLQSWIFSGKEGRKASGTNTSTAFSWRGFPRNSTPPLQLGQLTPPRFPGIPRLPPSWNWERSVRTVPRALFPTKYCQTQALWPRFPLGGERHCPSTCLCSCSLEKVTRCSDPDCTSNTCPSDSVWVASVSSSSLVSQESDQLYPHSGTCRGFRSPSCSVNWPSTPSLGFIYWNHFSWQGVLGVVMGRSEGNQDSQ